MLASHICESSNNLVAVAIIKLDSAVHEADFALYVGITDVELHYNEKILHIKLVNLVYEVHIIDVNVVSKTH